MSPPGTRSRPLGAIPGAAADAYKADRTAVSTTTRYPAQLLDDLGHRLPLRRSPVVGAPRLARPSWHRWAGADRWREVAR